MTLLFKLKFVLPFESLISCNNLFTFGIKTTREKIINLFIKKSYLPFNNVFLTLHFNTKNVIRVLNFFSKTRVIRTIYIRYNMKSKLTIGTSQKDQSTNDKGC